MKETIYTLIFKSGFKTRIVNLLTLYRIFICPVLLILIFNQSAWFKWILLSGFLTDAADGFLARKFKVITKLGSKLDSFADDCLFIIALISILVFHKEIIIENIIIIIILFIYFITKMILLWLKHKKIISGLHTYLSKLSAFFQVIFFLHALFFYPSSILFYTAIGITLIALMEEMIIICSFRDLKQNTRGIFFRDQI